MFISKLPTCTGYVRKLSLFFVCAHHVAYNVAPDSVIIIDSLKLSTLKSEIIFLILRNKNCKNRSNYFFALFIYLGFSTHQIRNANAIYLSEYSVAKFIEH